MLYTGSRRRALVAPCFVLIALACGSCSSDTRAILAPSDSQLSLAAGGTAIANQPLAITVVVTVKHPHRPVYIILRHAPEPFQA